VSAGGDRETAELARSLAARGCEAFDLAIVLGSGLGAFAGMIADAHTISCAEIPEMPQGRVPGHAARLVIGRIGGTRVLVQQGRVHLYESFGANVVARSVRAYAALGCRGLVLTNAAGGLDAKRSVPHWMRIRDHVNLQGGSPLLPHEAGRGSPYDAELGLVLERAAREAGIDLPSGVYCGLLGPSYESPAEIRFLARSGVHAVGMSTVQEALAAHAAGIRVCALSCISNHAAGIAGTPLLHADVVAAGERVSGELGRLLEKAVPELVAALSRERGGPPARGETGTGTA
jgi:purine-nucleoside phosphorylase